MSLVMVVEDENVLRESMVRSLRRLPEVEVIEASHFADARRLVHEERPALLISDLNLPDNSGLALFAELDSARLPIPVILMTAYLGHFREQIPHRKGLEVFEKPVPMNTLRDAVLQCLQASRTHRRAPFSFTEYVQMAALGRHSVLMRVVRDGVGRGWVRLVKGELWSARSGKQQGESALRRLIFMEGVHIDVERLEGEPGHREIRAPVEAVLLDAYRRLDEITRDRDTDSLYPTAIEADDDFEMEVPAPVALPPLPVRPVTLGGAARSPLAGPTSTMSARIAAASRPPLPALPSLPRTKAPEPVAAPPPPSPPPPSEFESLVAQGREALLLRDQVAALWAFEAAAQLEPDNTVVRAALARLTTTKR